MIVGVGIDIVDINRIQELMLKDLPARVLSVKEQVLYQALPSIRQPEWLAGRFAAKEAIFKAIPKETMMSIRQIEILYEEERPVCHIAGYCIHVSIAHEKDYAIAYAICEKK